MIGLSRLYLKRPHLMAPLWLALGLGLPVSAVAQGTPPLAEAAAQGDPQGEARGEIWLESEIVIHGHYRGPAMWKLTKGNAEIFVLGAMPVMVKRFDWDKGRVSYLMGQSQRFLSGPEARIGPMALLSVATNTKLGWGQTLDSFLAPELARRFHALEGKWNLKPDKYQHSRPLWAALQLRADVYDRAGLGPTDPERTLERMAKAKHVPEQPVSSFAAAPVLDRIAHFSRAEQLACVANILSEVEFSTQYAQTATEAWARADLKAMRPFMVNSAAMSCLEGNAATTQLLEKTVNDAVSAINAALSLPGRAMVVMPISVMVRQGGALEKLRAEGVQVTDPPDSPQ